MKYSIILSLVLLFVKASPAQINDAVKIAEARVALEKNDCKNALDALTEVSDAGKKTALYNLYMGKAYDCDKDYDNAITYYEVYILSNPNAADIIQRIAELRYEKRKKEKKYDLAGIWQVKDDPAKLRTMEQDGDHIKLFDPEEADDDRAIKFEGDLQPNSVFKGGRFWYMKKMYSFPNSDECDRCFFTNMEYKDDDDEFKKETSQDILTVSSDGNTITIRMQVPRVTYTSTRIVEWEGERVQGTRICSIQWETKYYSFIRVNE